MASAYDIWKTTEPDEPRGIETARCAHFRKGRHTIISPARFYEANFIPCNIPMEEHDDEALGHLFVMPEEE